MRADGRKSRRKKKSGLPMIIIAILLGIACTGLLVYGGYQVYDRIINKEKEPDIEKPVIDNPEVDKPVIEEPVDKPELDATKKNIELPAMTIFLTDLGTYNVEEAKKKQEELLSSKILTAVVEDEKLRLLGGVFFNEDKAITNAQKIKKVDENVKLLKREMTATTVAFETEDVELANLMEAFVKDFTAMIDIKMSIGASYQKNYKYEMAEEHSKNIADTELKVAEYASQIEAVKVSKKAKDKKQLFLDTVNAIVENNIATSETMGYEQIQESAYKQINAYMVLSLNCR